MSDPTPSAGQDPPDDSRATSLSLLAMLIDSKADAWTRLDHLYTPLICYWCRRWGVPPQDVDDIRQDVNGVLFQHLPDFLPKHPGAFRAWLRSITRNTCFNHLRKINGQPCAEGGSEAGKRLQEIPESDATLNGEDDPVDQRRALLDRTLASIHPEFSRRDWEAFRLVDVEGLTSAEAGVNLGMTALAVRQARHRIRRRAHQALGDL